MGGSEIFDYASAAKLDVLACPACGSDARRWVRYGFDRYGYRVGLATCAACSLTYLMEQLTREGYDAFYAGPYRRLVWSMHHPDRPLDAEAHMAEIQASQQVYGRVLRQYLSGMPRGRVLDAGGSTGVVAREAGFTDVTVLDPAAQELPAQGAIRGYLEDPIPGGPYDAILCCETLDHLTSPRAALANMRAVLAPGGYLFVDAIDKQSWATDDRRIKVDHPLYWTNKALLAALRAAGFAIERNVIQFWGRAKVHKRWAIAR